MTYKLIYLTGAPATGKTTLSKQLESRIPNLKRVDYGELLLEIKKKEYPNLTYEQMRSQSGEIVSPKDVASIDQYLLAWVSAARLTSHVLIDTHPVTREAYGFRAAPFRYSQIIELDISAVISLYAPAKVIVERIQKDASGRYDVSLAQAEKHSSLQDSMSFFYSILCGCPIYVIESDKSPEILTALVTELLLEEIGMH